MQHIAEWDKESTLDETIKFLKKLALSHAAQGGEQGKRIASCITSGDFLSVCDFSVNYETASVFECANIRQAIAFFAKLERLDLGRDKRAAAVVTYWESENACRETNELFKLRAQGSVQFEPWVESVIFRAQSKIARVLGDVPTFSELGYRLGPGATALTKKSKANISQKLGAGISCSEDLFPFASRILEEMPHLAQLHRVADETSNLDQGDAYSDGNEDDLEAEMLYESELEAQRSREEACGIYERDTVLVNLSVVTDKVTFVPKNAKTYRGISVGGDLNMMVQLAIGDYMTDRLKKFGIDLRDQTINQRFALRGSLDGSLATLDLKSASDTISSEIVHTLLPIYWALTLDVCRSSLASLDDKEFKMEKFSSMGNGYTFPLESLIFWALSSAAAEDGFASVYGDDIIVSTDSVPRVTRILQIFGFTLNDSKSYWTGPFRESCGADYIRGIDIRPYYQKKLISPAELFRLHNFYVRRGDEERAKMVLDQINPCLRLYGPDGYGDGHLLGDWIPVRKKRHIQNGYGGVIFDTFAYKAKRNLSALRPGDRLLPTYSIYINNVETAYKFEPRSLSNESFAGLYGRYRKFQTSIAPEEIPERVSPVDGRAIKSLATPGTCGYRRMSIYTLSTSRTPCREAK